MPNWCHTSYKCVGDLNEVKRLYNVIKDIDECKTSLLANDFGNRWLGNLIHNLGGGWKEYSCRGEITDYSFKDNVLTIEQSTAWSEQEGVRRIIEEKFPNVKVYFQEEELGCDVLNTNDVAGNYFPERYFLRFSGESEYFDTIEDVAECVSEIVGHKIEPHVKCVQEAFKSYIEEHVEENQKDCFSFHEFAVSD